MKLISIETAKHTSSPNAVELSLTADLEDGIGPQSLPFGWVVGDTHGLGPQIDAFMAAHPDFTIAPYVAPTPSTNPNDYPLRPDQFWSMMDIAGLRAKALAAIDAIPDPVQKIIASNKLNHVQVFERSNPLFETLKGAVGMTDAQIDAMWLQAKDIP